MHIGTQITLSILNHTAFHSSPEPNHLTLPHIKYTLPHVVHNFRPITFRIQYESVTRKPGYQKSDHERISCHTKFFIHPMFWIISCLCRARSLWRQYRWSHLDPNPQPPFEPWQASRCPFVSSNTPERIHITNLFTRKIFLLRGKRTQIHFMINWAVYRIPYTAHEVWLV